MNRFAGTALLLAAIGTIGAASTARAQKPAGLPDNYPNKPIRIIISSSPGGAIDICARMVTTKLSERWGNVIAENRPGNGVAHDAVMRSAPDGYTLMASSISSFIGAELVLKVPYNVRTKFPAVAQCISTPYIVSVNSDLPVKNIQEFIAYAKANPRKLNFAYSAIGGGSHLFGELLNIAAGLDLQGIPFKGVGPAYLEQMAGRINLTLGTAASAGPLAKSGKIKAIAVSGAKRIKSMPDLPTVRESLPNFDSFEAWVGILGVEGMNPGIINALNREINSLLSQPDAERTLTADGSEIPLNTPAQFQKVIVDSLESTARIIKQANVKME